MTTKIPTGQLIGSYINQAIFLVIGGYLAWIRPARIRRRVRSGEISEEQAKESLKKIPSWLGYIVLVGVAVYALSDFLGYTT